VSEKVKLTWYCGHFVGPCKWQNLDTFEPDECCAEGETEADLDDWECGVVMVKCSSCGAELWQEQDHFQLVKGEVEDMDPRLYGEGKVPCG
jgi:hypothetical protein